MTIVQQVANVFSASVQNPHFLSNILNRLGTKKKYQCTKSCNGLCINHLLKTVLLTISDQVFPTIRSFLTTEQTMPFIDQVFCFGSLSKTATNKSLSSSNLYGFSVLYKQ